MVLATSPALPSADPTPEPPAPLVGTRLPLLAIGFTGLFGVLLASFPARNLDLWKHLAAGRDLLRGNGLSPTWLYDLAVYALYSLGSGVGLVVAKAALCGVIAILVLRLSRRDAGWVIPLTVTGLATLTMGSRLLLQPATLSILGLVFTLVLLRREEDQPTPRVWPGWRLPVLFAVWANVDGWFVLGLLVVALTWLGKLLDHRPSQGFARWGGAVGVLVVASCLSPAHLTGLRVPPELQTAATALVRDSDGATVYSAFERAYLTLFWDRPAALAYYPLLALGLLSFLLNRSGWRWAWFLPWLALAVVSGLQIRTAPLFAAVGGPILAWNLQAFFARRAAPPVRSRGRMVALTFTALVAGAFLVSAWPGWLQGPPFEPRRWAVETPRALAGGAEFLQRGHANGLFASEARTLHLSPDTHAAFAWFAPDDRGILDDALAGQLLQNDGGRRELRARGVERIVLHAAEPAATPLLAHLVANPEEWPILHLTGGVVILGWCDPEQPARTDRYRKHEVDLTRLDSFRPLPDAAPPPAPESPQWWDVFYRRAPSRSPYRDEAAVLLMKADTLRRTAPYRHLVAWDATQAASLAGAAGAWTGPGGWVDLTFRLAIIQPPPTEGPPTSASPAASRLAFALNQRFWFVRGDVPIGALYAAIRAARQSLAEDPTDATSYLLLGQAYTWLSTHSAERAWGARVSQLGKIRQQQALAALNRAATLNPKLAQAHLELARLYPQVLCLDLSAAHLRAYRDLAVPKGDPRRESLDAELTRLDQTVERQTKEFDESSARTSVADRALTAAQRGLVGKARDLLLKSDISAFGLQGMELELDLLLRTGRPNDVLDWTTPELEQSLGSFKYHWFRVQAYAAAGDIANADAELAALCGPTGEFPDPVSIATIVGQLTGTAVLNEQLGGPHLSQLIWRALGRADFQSQLYDLSQTLARLSDVMVLRGVIALEAGRLDQARAAFRTALTFAPVRGGEGQMDFDGRTVAWDGLGLLDQQAAKPKAP